EDPLRDRDAIFPLRRARSLKLKIQEIEASQIRQIRFYSSSMFFLPEMYSLIAFDSLVSDMSN
ncbi:hypothetical protein LINPERHAP1_LOCUS11382, partial [Linum perenne]